MIVSLQNVTCGYEDKAIFENLNLEIATGSFVGLVGPSGAGKTTLLRLLMGQVKISNGQVKVNDSKVANGWVIDGLGYVPQLETVDWNFPVTVEQVVLMGRLKKSGWLPWSNAVDQSALKHLLERLGLAKLAKRHIRELSGGQQQRVFLARALIAEPKLLLLDEPTSNVDVKTRQEILTLLKELNQQGISIILTTHDLNSVAAHLPQVVCINKAIIAQGPPCEIFTNLILSQTYEAALEVIEHEDRLFVIEKT